MADVKKILFTSNCFGEDRSAAMIAALLKERIAAAKVEGWEVCGASLISPGTDYSSRGVEILYASELPPSGGFPTHSVKGFFADLFSGSVGNLGRYRKRLREAAPEIALCVVAGDVPLVWLTRRELKDAPFVFIDLPKSDYIAPHFGVEKRYIARACDVIFFRDEYTASNMARGGLNALFYGNSLMDGLESSDTAGAFKTDRPLVALLPGSRDEAYANFLSLLEVVEQMSLVSEDGAVQYAAALPGTLADGRLTELAAKRGWRYHEGKPFGVLRKGTAEVLLTRGIFPGVLKASTLVVGLAGTANEQAAGLGKTVVAFKGSGPQTTARRFSEQGRLLGKALRYVDGDARAVASEVLRLTGAPNELLHRGAEGGRRMGEPGASRRIADYLFEHYVAK